MKKILKAIKNFFTPLPKPVIAEPEPLPVNQEFNDKKPVSPISYVEQICLKLFELGMSFIGINESRNEKEIRIFHNHSNAKGSGAKVAWCSSFMNYLIYLLGLTGTGSALARSWLKWGRKIESPIKGCIVVFWRDSISSHLGHVALYSHMDEKYIYVLGGNQDNKVSIKAYPKERLLAFIVPSQSMIDKISSKFQS
jgi:uncharacterized protein (TIGR02594 family)